MGTQREPAVVAHARTHARNTRSITPPSTTYPQTHTQDGGHVVLPQRGLQGHLLGLPWHRHHDRDRPFARLHAWREPPQVDSLDGGEGKCTYNVGDTTGTAVYYFRALAVDSSGKFIAASQDAEDGYFQVNSHQGRTQSIIVGVAV